MTSFDDPLRLAAIATFLFQPTFMDILPQYIVYMLFAPVLVKLCLDGKWAYVMAGSLLVWMAGQLGLQQIVTTPLNELVKGPTNRASASASTCSAGSWCFIRHWSWAR